LISNTSLAPNLSEANFITRLKALNSKIKNWKKKKQLLAVLLQKTSLRYAKAQMQMQKRNLFSDEYFPLNRKHIVNNYAKNLYTNNLKKIKLSTKIKQPEA
jgi:hypothetical protein